MAVGRLLKRGGRFYSWVEKKGRGSSTQWEKVIFPKKAVSFDPPSLRPRAHARCTAHSTKPDFLKLDYLITILVNLIRALSLRIPPDK